MIESVLVADSGPVATRIITSCRRAGVKTIAVAVADDGADRGADERTNAGPVGRADRLADDVVLLPDIAASGDGAAVLNAALAAGAEAVHPGRTALRGDVEWSRRMRAAGLIAITSDAGGLAPPESKSARAVDVVVLADPLYCLELGTVSRGERGWVVPAQTDELELARQVARTAVAQHELSGLLCVTVDGGHVSGVDAGLPSAAAAIEATSALDLVQLQLAQLGGAFSPPTRVFSRGTAITRDELDVVADSRILTATSGLRLDVTPLRAHGHESVVWATAHGSDLPAAQDVLSTYIRSLAGTVGAR